MSSFVCQFVNYKRFFTEVLYSLVGYFNGYWGRVGGTPATVIIWLIDFHKMSHFGDDGHHERVLLPGRVLVDDLEFVVVDEVR
jgi:hypothetical protein